MKMTPRKYRILLRVLTGSVLVSLALLLMCERIKVANEYGLVLATLAILSGIAINSLLTWRHAKRAQAEVDFLLDVALQSQGGHTGASPMAARPSRNRPSSERKGA